MGKTKIEWATHTVNWLAGCTKVSPACAHCYAEVMSARLSTMPQAPPRYHDGVIANRRWTGRLSYDAAALADVFSTMRGWRPDGRIRRLFANSMSDTFHADAPPASLTDLADEIRRFQAFREDCADTVEWRVLMLLTKRPERLLSWQREHFPDGLPSWVWVGCTVEDQPRADERIPLLLQVQAAVRFLSCEPLLGLIDLTAVRDGSWFDREGADYYNALTGSAWWSNGDHGLGGGPWIGCVITGGESGPGARPSHPDWFRSLRDQCNDADIPYFFKQWGRWQPRAWKHDGGTHAMHALRPISFQALSHHPDSIERADEASEGWQAFADVGKHAAGRLLDGCEHNGMPEVNRG